MLQAPHFDDPARVADYGYFPHERNKPLVLTGDDLASAIRSGVAPDGAPFRDWVPLLFEGSRFAPITVEDALRDFKVWLDSSEERTVGGAMDTLSDIAFENYGGES